MFVYAVQVYRVENDDDFRSEFCSFTNGKDALKFARDVQENPDVCVVMITVHKNED